MNHIERSLTVKEKQEFVTIEMAQQGLTVTELAALANLTLATAVNFVEHRTFSPHGTTFDALIHALGYCVALPDGRTISPPEEAAIKRRRGRGRKRKEG